MTVTEAETQGMRRAVAPLLPSVHRHDTAPLRRDRVAERRSQWPAGIGASAADEGPRVTASEMAPDARHHPLGRTSPRNRTGRPAVVIPTAHVERLMSHLAPSKEN